MARLLLTRLLAYSLIFVGLAAFRQDAPTRLTLFLLIGQSNMAGRGVVEVTDTQPHPRVWMFTKEETWVSARDPLHFDKPTIVGVGPGLTFGKKLAEVYPDRQIGLIPAAVGGSHIDAWLRGAYYAPTNSYPYDDALRRAKKALERGELAGILWLQGESDARSDRSLVYGQKLSELIQRLRTDLNTPSVPFVVATLGDFLVARNAEAAKINQTLKDAPKNNKYTYCILTTGLTHKGDTTHFDAPSARTIGLRYADVFIKNKLLSFKK